MLTAHAQTFKLTDEDRVLKQLSKQFQENTQNIQIPKNKYAVEAKAQATELFETLKSSQMKEMVQRKKKVTLGRMLYFASQSLTLEELQDVFYASTKDREGVVVFRGVRDPDNLSQSLMEIQRIAAQQSPVPNVVIDPSLYLKYNITKVPTIVYLDEDKETELARVAGLTEPDWLLRQIASHNLKDFGVKGDVEEILERDLIEVMKEKMAKIDWNQKKENAKKRFWSHQNFYDLPKAVRRQTKELDPSIQVTQDITDNVGNIIVAQGTIINPLELRPFTQALVIFNPNDKTQVALVDAQLLILKKKYNRIKLLVTQLSTDEGWDAYKNVTDYFDSEIFLLTADIKSRFNINVVPSVVTADLDKKIFIIDELAIDEEGINE